jgi:fucose permease
MAAGCLVITQSRSYVLILAMVFAVGVGQTLIQTSGNPLIRQLDTPQNYHRNLTFTIAFATFGGFLSIFFLAGIRGRGWPWQACFFLFAAICVTSLVLLSLSRFPPCTGSRDRIRLDEIGKLLSNPILLTYGLGVYIYVAAEFGTYFWIPKFFEDVHHVPAAASNASAVTFLQRTFPSLPALVYALFLGMQGVGRLVGGAIMNRFGCRRILRFYSAMALVSLIVATFGSKSLTTAGFVACGFFTSVIFTLIVSGTINSFSEYQGTISGFLCTAYVASALVSPLEGWVGDHFGMRRAMLVPILLLSYVLGLAMLGRAKYE